MTSRTLEEINHVPGRRYKGVYVRLPLSHLFSAKFERSTEGLERVDVWLALERVPTRCTWGEGRCPEGDMVVRFPDGFEASYTEDALSLYYVCEDSIAAAIETRRRMMRGSEAPCLDGYRDESPGS